MTTTTATERLLALADRWESSGSESDAGRQLVADLREVASTNTRLTEELAKQRTTNKQAALAFLRGSEQRSAELADANRRVEVACKREDELRVAFEQAWAERNEARGDLAEARNKLVAVYETARHWNRWTEKATTDEVDLAIRRTTGFILAYFGEPPVGAGMGRGGASGRPPIDAPITTG